MAELDRFLEDQLHNRVRAESIGKSLVKLTSLVAEERKQIMRMSQLYKLDRVLEQTRRSGKPFYWVDLEKVRQLKQFCERQSDAEIRAKAFAALKEYEGIIDQYNFSAKVKITDIFPQKNTKDNSLDTKNNIE